MNWLEESKAMIEGITRAVEFAAALIIAVPIRGNSESSAHLSSAYYSAYAQNEVRLTLGKWLAVALEFGLAADILNTPVTPSWTDIDS